MKFANNRTIALLSRGNGKLDELCVTAGGVDSVLSSISSPGNIP